LKEVIRLAKAKKKVVKKGKKKAVKTPPSEL